MVGGSGGERAEEIERERGGREGGPYHTEREGPTGVGVGGESRQDPPGKGSRSKRVRQAMGPRAGSSL